MTPQRPLRILLVAHYFPPHVGGIENVVRGQAEHLAARGHEVTVVTTASGAPAGRQRAPHGYEIVRLRTWNGVESRTGVPFPLVTPWSARSVLRLVRSVDVVHCHDLLYVTTWLAVLAATVLRKPVVLTQHVGVVAHPRRVVETVQRLVYATAGRFAARRASHVCVLNGGVLDFVRGLGASPENVRLLPNGVDTETFHPGTPEEKRALRARLGLPADVPLALFVGRAVPKKGYDKVLASAGPDYALVLVGGPVPSGPAAPDVVHLGPRPHDEIVDVFRACDIFVLPSESEGFPLTVQEAMACGLPVVTSDDPTYDVYGFDRELITLIPPTVPEIRRALTRLARDGPLRSRMGQYSLAQAHTTFSWSGHVDALEGIYADTLAVGTADPGVRGAP